MKEELKPCPFCGGEVELIYWPEETIIEISPYDVECKKCDLSMSCKTTEEDAIKAWNARVKD